VAQIQRRWVTTCRAFGPAMGTGMKARIWVLVLAMIAGAFVGAAATPAATIGYVYCGTYGSYVLLYKSNDQFEELGKMRCGEKVEVLNRWFDYVQVRALDGRVGWVHNAEISNAPMEAPTKNLGLTDPSAKPQGAEIRALGHAPAGGCAGGRQGAVLMAGRRQV